MSTMVTNEPSQAMAVDGMLELGALMEGVYKSAAIHEDMSVYKSLLGKQMVLTVHDDAAATRGLHDDTATARRPLHDVAAGSGGSSDHAAVGNGRLHDDTATTGGLHDDAATAGGY